MYRIYLNVRYRQNRVVEVPAGRLKGLKLHAFVRTTVPSYLTGQHELDLQEALVREVRAGTAFYDVGGHGGFFALLASKLVGPQGQVVVFEPHPESAREIRCQLQLNHVRNVEIVAAAIANSVGHADFADDRSADMLTLAALRSRSPTFQIRVPTTTLDAELSKRRAPEYMKIDIEGAEVLALEGGMRVLSDHHPVCFMELHSRDLAIQCRRILTNLGYTAYRLSGEPLQASQECMRLMFKKTV